MTIYNTGNADLTFDPTTSRIGGSGRRNFLFAGFPTAPTTIVAGASLTLNITGQLLKGQTDTVGATLVLSTSDTINHTNGNISIPLRAFNANTA